MAQTSDRVSSIAARYVNITSRELAQKRAGELVKDIRALAASVLRQDETRGLRGLVRKVTGL